MAITPIATLFAKSPFRPIQEHMRAVLECAREIPAMIEAVCKGNEKALNTHKQRIFEKEAIADGKMNELRSNLPKSLFIPVDRRDLLDVLQMQDSIANSAQDIAGMLVQRRMQLPEQLHAPLIEFTQSCLAVCEQSGKIIEQLDELVELGFKGREVKRVAKMVEDLNRSEDATDELGLNLTHNLFDHGENMNPVPVIMWYQTIQWIGDLADNAEDVGNRLRLLLAR